MKVAPVFSTISFINRNNGQSLSGINKTSFDCKKPCYEDVFVRLADASLKDKNIEAELRSMGLI